MSTRRASVKLSLRTIKKMISQGSTVHGYKVLQGVPRSASLFGVDLAPKGDGIVLYFEDGSFPSVKAHIHPPQMTVIAEET